MFVPLSVLDFRDRAAAFFGDKIGVIDGEREFTYREFAERTHRLANALVGLGVEPGDRVSFITYNTHHLLEAYYGVLEAGAVLNPINIRLAPHEIAWILDHAGSKVVFFHRDFLPLVEQIGPGLEARPAFVVLDGEAGGIAEHEYEGLLATGRTDPLEPEIDENGLAELFYTSGTTGLPKGVAMTHRQLYLHSLIAELGLGFTEADVVLHVVPLFHVNGWGTPHFLTMIGGRHVMLRKFDPGALIELVERHQVTRLLAVPSIFNAVLNHRDRAKHDLSSLRQLIIGGSPAAPSLVRALEAELGVEAIVGYGLTETSPIITLAQPREVLTSSEPPERRAERKAMTGWAIPGVRIRVVDAEGVDVRPEATGDRRDRGPGQYRHGRLLPRPGGDRGGDPRRLVPHRGYGHDRPGRLHPDPGSLEGHHHHRRREHLVGRDRDGDRRPSGRPRVRRDRGPGREAGRGAGRPGRPEAGRGDQREGAQGVLPAAPGRLQGPARDPLPRRPAEGRHGQDPESRACASRSGPAWTAASTRRPTSRRVIGTSCPGFCPGPHSSPSWNPYCAPACEVAPDPPSDRVGARCQFGDGSVGDPDPTARTFQLRCHGRERATYRGSGWHPSTTSARSTTRP